MSNNTERRPLFRTFALAGALSVSLAATAAHAQERSYKFDIPPQPLSNALRDYGRAADQQLIFTEDLVRGQRTPGLKATLEAGAALDRLLAGTDLTWRRASSGGIMIVRRDDVRPQSEATAVSVATEPPRLVDELVVTGTNIRGAAVTVPVIEINRGDFERGGFLDVGQALRTLSVNFGGGINLETSVGGVQTDNANFNRGRGSTANLRGLGSGATLVLLNGNRLPAAGEGLAVDISMIPIAAVERVDVLADGASSIYGADAVAGVVNIITRRAYDGVEARVRYGGAKGGLETYGASLFGGGRWGDLSGVAGVEHLDQGSLLASDRAASRLRPQPATLFADTARTSYFGSGRYDIGPRARLVGDAVYMQRIITGEIVTNLSPALSIFSGRKISQYSVSGGLVLQLGDTWTLDTSATTNRNLTKTRTATVSRSGAPTRLGGNRYQFDLATVEARASGRLFSWRAGSVDAAVGAAFRDENSVLKGDTLSRVGRTVASLYGELNVPLVDADSRRPFVEELRLTLSGRHDDYSDFGEANAPKVGVMWRPIPSVALNATYSKSFRAPSPFDGAVNYFAATLDTADNTPSGTSPALFLAGTGAPLGPERSENINISLIYEPEWFDDLRLTLGYYDVEYTDRIATPDPTGVFVFDVRKAPATLIQRAPSQATITALVRGASAAFDLFGRPFDPTNVTVIIDDRVTNLATTTIKGVQASASFHRDFRPGALDLTLDLTYVSDFSDQLLASSPSTQRVDTIFSPPDLRSRLGAVWTAPQWSASLYWNYTDNYIDNRRTTALKSVESWNTFDASLSYDFGARPNTDDKGARVILSVTNVFDENPPEIAPTTFSSATWDAANASILGRFVSIEVVKKW
ncbi:MAG: TonB-dependent receptor [Phenylobacterium sp.]|uniref:TonB-dependent receptor n=1 Tax=Phenylobacterium sp. TaxID=1871053 RepID=UPI002735BFF8|nr:TonB-dependent receptor [Phenylobacterium sp.]MDP3749279.1 TonB-dependent receptor [Phenylobacterium sp.]